ncbi:oligosaccharyl transferase, archaeosortase A system-associated [Chloroflexota bacterium]
MSLSKISPKIITAVLLVVIFVLALCIRTVLPSERVFSDEGIKYTSADAYYNIRQVDNLAHNYPNHTDADPYFIYPRETLNQVHVRFFAWMLATISWIIGLGAPTQHIVDLVGVYVPAVFGALMIIPVYLIGREIFGRWAGLLSAGLLAILPGEFLGRSILGFADYHIAETLFTTTAMMFLILAIKRASQRQITFNHVRKPDWPVIRKPLIYSLLAGFFIGLYIWTWAGALLFVFIIFLYFVIQFIIDHLRKKSTEYLCFVSTPFFLFALIISLLFPSGQLYYASLIVALIAPVVLCGVSWLSARKGIKPVYYPLTILGLGLAGLGLFYLTSPSLVSSMLNSFTNFIPQGAHKTTIEMMPLISPDYTMQYGSPFSIVWGNYPGLIPIEPNQTGISFQNILSFMTTSFFYALVSLGILIYLVIKRGENGKILLVIWSLIILISNLLQRRFGYYYAVNVALLVGYLSWRVLERGGFKESAEGSEEEAVKETTVKKVRPKKKDSFVGIRRAIMGFTVIIVLVVVYPWNIETTVNTAKAAQFAPSNAWVSSLEWLKENTPEPFGSSDSYYEMFELPPKGENFEYPESAYGVLAWWDYGYWITRIGHRLPTANPSQNPEVLTNVALYFTSQDEESADEIIQEVDASYVILDHTTAYNKFHAIATWAGEQLTEYYDYFVWQEEENWKYGPLFYPEYYNSLITRLYIFNGEAVTPESVSVISFQETMDATGNVYKQITGERIFDTFEEAEAYISSQESLNLRIVSRDIMASPVPLNKLEHYRLIHSSDDLVGFPGQIMVPAIKIFEYVE